MRRKFRRTRSHAPAGGGRLPAPNPASQKQERPAYTGLGARIEQLLRLAEEQATEVVHTARSEANEIKATAKGDAPELPAGAANDPTQLRAHANRETHEQHTTTHPEPDSLH